MDALVTTLINNIEYVGGVVVAFVILYWHLPARDHESILLSRFGLSDKDWMLLGHDLGKGGKPLHVRGLGLIGTPDFVVQARRGRIIKVYDYKHRRYRGKLRPYEVYQVTLYAMVLEVMKPGYAIEAGIRFKDAIVDIPLKESNKRLLLDNRAGFRKHCM